MSIDPSAFDIEQQILSSSSSFDLLADSALSSQPINGNNFLISVSNMLYQLRNILNSRRSYIDSNASNIVVILSNLSLMIVLSGLAMTHSNFYPGFIFAFCAYFTIGVAYFITWTYQAQDQSSHKLQAIFVWGMPIINGIFLLSRVLNGYCINSNNSWSCIPSRNALPLSLVVPMLLNPFVNAIFFSSVEWIAHIASFFITFAFLLTATISLFSNSSDIWVASMSYLIFGLLFLIEHNYKSVDMQRMNEILKQSIEESDRNRQHEYNREMRHLIGNLAHDLKTPLTATTVAIEHLASDIKDLTLNLLQNFNFHGSKSTHTALAQMSDICVALQDTNQFMLMTINRCLDYSKTSNGISLATNLTSFRLSDAIYLPVNCVRRMQSMVTVTVDIQSILMNKAIVSDQIWLQENILCLLSNAVQHSNEGNVRVSVSLLEIGKIEYSNIINKSMREVDVQSPCYLLIEVEDMGQGLPDDEMLDLFVPLKQAQRGAGGTGLGLFALANRLKSIDGMYGLHNRVDGTPGAVFWFAVPYNEDPIEIVNESPSPSPTYRSSLHIDSPMSPQRPGPIHTQSTCTDISCPSTPSSSSDIVESPRPMSLNILLVDDALPIQKVLASALRKCGHNVDIVDNGLKATKALSRRRIMGSDVMVMDGESSLITGTCNWYDVVLMDLQMPVMGGIEAIRKIREEEDLLRLPRQFIVAMSANSDIDSLRDANAAGTDDFIPKPFLIDKFNAITNVMRMKKAGIDSPK